MLHASMASHSCLRVLLSIWQERASDSPCSEPKWTAEKVVGQKTAREKNQQSNRESCF